jgi:hypothetical protein
MNKVARFGLTSLADFLEAAVTHVTTKKPRRSRRSRVARTPRVQRSVYRSRAPRTVVVHVYAGATVNLTNV